MKPAILPNPGRRPLPREKGFALVVTLSLMILLTIMAVGLLSLAGVSLRTTSQSASMEAARANARMALMIALGQLQRELGPDSRISMNADQRSAPGGDGDETAVPVGNRHWTGVYNAWPGTEESRPAPSFRRWLVSGDPERLKDDNYASSAVSNGIELVGEGTLGDASNGRVVVPASQVRQNNGKNARIGWWIADQGTKAAIATQRQGDTSKAALARLGVQSAPRNAVELVSTSGGRPFPDDIRDKKELDLVTSWAQAGFVANSPHIHKELFHDLAPFSSGLLTNVRDGGFRKDLSLALETPLAALPPTALYQVNGENGINLRELAAYHGLWNDLLWTGGATFTTGGRIASRMPFLQLRSSPSECANDERFDFKMPVIVNYQMVFSFKSEKVTVSGQTRNRLHIVSDPIITFWNPLDVPVVIPTTAYVSVKYWQLPYDFYITRGNSAPIRCPLLRSLSNSWKDGHVESDANYFSIRIGETGHQLVLKPGEVLKTSERGVGGKKGDHNLKGGPGFNYGNGVSLPLVDMNGQFIDLADNETITYEVRSNNLTSGKTNSSGNTLSGSTVHTRHFSLTHHETYIGADRGGSGSSLGYGGMFIDFDFGNKRLTANDKPRGETQAGTKPSNERLYADRFPSIFKPITKAQGRPLSASQLQSDKAPFMIFSFSAKTETETDRGTRFLSRLNPRAKHIDFYNLSDSERDILPYEVRVEPLVSWKNRSLEVSTNGNAYFGGGLNAQYGSSFVTTHSVPREPIVSMAALQHSMANGFERFQPVWGYATLTCREPLLPHVSHAIGNSMAPPMIPPNQTSAGLPGGRSLADHSYLANRELWDDWFFSGISSQNRFSNGSLVQRNVAIQFFEGNIDLPTARYRPELDGEDPRSLAVSFFRGSVASDTGIENVASHLRVDGMFNVNSTSVEAWKAVLASLKDSDLATSDDNGSEKVKEETGETPVIGLLSPRDNVASGPQLGDVSSPNQWSGRRTLTDAEIEELAKQIVREVRKRGPFTSLSDFVNRRVGNDKDLARCGAVQAALESDNVSINRAYLSNTRSVPGGVAGRFAFPEGEEGPLAYGIPGFVKQADILTPIAPILSTRSDTFLIRAYGEAVDAGGNVTARAWCEALVSRNRNFVDPADNATTPVIDLKNNVNREFGRRFDMLSFRWLNASEI